uniref:Prs_0 protein n=1 Tax=Fopius arisanus TaxID=64838 RepID=A0A0C9Q5I5_9HYME
MSRRLIISEAQVLFFPGAIKNRGSTGIYESAYVINSSVRTQNTDPGLQVLKMLKTNLLADQVRLVHDFRSISPPEEINSQNVDSTSPQPIVSQEYDEKISEPEFIFISDNEKEQILPDMEDTLSSGENLAIEKNGSLDNETASDSQVILISNDEEVQFVSQQIISQNVREIFTFEENISSAENSLLREEVNVKQQSFSFPKPESSIETINSLTLPSASSTHEFTGEEYEGSSLEIDSLSTRNFKCHENSRCPENMSYKKVNSRKSNASLNYRVMSSDVDTISSPIPGRKISNPEDVQSLEDVNFYDEPACQVSQPISSTVDEYFSAENCTDTTENLRCTYSEIATQSTSYATSTDNSNPWLSVTSKDFSQGDCFDNASARSQDSGQASKDSLISLRSFISTISKEETDDDEEETSHDRFLSIRQMLKMKASAIQKEIKRIILWLENEI